MKKTIFLIVVLSFFLLSLKVSALTVGPHSPIRIELENGDKILNLTSWAYYADAPPELRNEYLPSGLYYNTAPPEIIYLVYSNSYFREENIYISNDGMYFVDFIISFYWGPKSETPIPPLPGRIFALDFYANGNLIRRYDVLELVEDYSELRQTSTRVFWKQQHNFDAENNILSVMTVDDITYMFDITTGEIMSINDVEVAPKTGDDFIIILFILIAGTVFAIKVKFKEKSK